MSLSVWLSLTCSVSVPRQTNRREKLFSCFISVCGLRDGWQSYRSPSCAIRLRRVGLVITFVSQVFRAAIRLCAVYWSDLCLSLCRLPFGSAPCTDEICVSVVCHSTVHRVLMTFVSPSFGVPFDCAPCTDDICVSVVCHSTLHRVLMTFVSLSFGVPFDCAPCTDDICVSVFRCAIRLCTVYWWHFWPCLLVYHSTERPFQICCDLSACLCGKRSPL